jgi:hypothetical protein
MPTTAAEKLHRLQEVLFDKHSGGSVRDAADRICDMGYKASDLELEGYDHRRKWTMKTLCEATHVYHPRMGCYVNLRALKVNDLRVRWAGGPPRHQKVYTGTMLMCLIDYILYDAALNREITQHTT